MVDQDMNNFPHISQELLLKYHIHFLVNLTSKIPNITFSSYNGKKDMTQLEEVMNILYVVLAGIFSSLSMIGTRGYCRLLTCTILKYAPGEDTCWLVFRKSKDLYLIIHTKAHNS